jgi:hypothetical protein
LSPNNNNNNNQRNNSNNYYPPPSTAAAPDDEVIERIRLRIPNAHVFKLPPKPTSGGWRGAEWRDKVWQGTLKIVERGHDTTLVLLVDSQDERNIFATCPIRHDIGLNNNSRDNTTITNGGSSGGGGSNAGNGVDRCIDSSRYFVLRIQNFQTGRHMYIGLAFNERNDAFDFNTSLEDSRREKECEYKAELLAKEMELLDVTTNDTAANGQSGSVRKGGGGMNYTMKEGEKIHVKIPILTNNKNDDNDNYVVDDDDNTTTDSLSHRPQQKISLNNRNKAVSKSSGGGKGGGFLKPSTKDTPSRLAT